MGEQRADPVGGPASLGLVVDVAQRLEGETAAIAMFGLRPQAMMAAAHRQHGGTGGKAHVEDYDTRARIATLLQGDRTSVVKGKSGYGRLDIGGLRTL